VFIEMARPNSQLTDSDPLPETAWHQLEIGVVLERLQTGPSGLAAHEAQHRLSTYGANTIDLKESRAGLRILLAQFTDFMILILMAAAVVSGIIGDFKDTVVIGAIILLNGAIGFIQEYRAERALQALKQMAAPSANTIRDGRNITVNAADVVPGDVVLVEAGGVVPADMRILETSQLRVEEAALTGEAHAIEKSPDALPDAELPLGDRVNMAYMGTVVVHGRGRAVVVATGIETEFGKIAKMLHTTQESATPLQRRLEQFGKRIAVAALLAAVFILLLGLLRGEPFVRMLLTAISLAVAAIPEALPAVVTIALALGARRMVQKKALVRKLSAVEALGSVTVICSDKTGTLTQNRMSAERFHCNGTSTTTPGSDGAWRELLLGMALNNDVRIDMGSAALGDPTEVALYNAALEAGVSKSEVEKRYPRIAELPFDSDRKLMTTLHQDPNGTVVGFTKGATEALLAKSVAQVGNDTARDATSAAAEEMASLGLRVLGFGTRRWEKPAATWTAEVAERDLTIIGLVGIGDPIRQEARDAVEMCRHAGIITVMITGDHPATAQAIAKQIGISTDSEHVLTGRELASFDESALSTRVESVRVYARVAPDQKLKIVRALQKRGHLVAMTGDGVNDAPALKQAEIGVAMGITGTDVAKQAGSLILLDDNFATIVRAVREGRKIYDNLRRFIRYAVTTNLSEILTMLVAPLLGLPMPLLPLQILWINLITDGLPGLAMAAEPAESNVMQRPPRHPSEGIFARGLGTHVVWVGSFMAGLAILTQVIGLRTESPEWQTMVLCVMAFSQLAHVMAIRSERDSLFKQGLLSNKPLLGAVLFTVMLQLALVYLPKLNELFDTHPLPLRDLVWTFLLGSTVFVAVEIEKWIRRRQ